MPRVVIPKKDLPPISAADNDYNIRLRLVSQDRNRSSFWTPLYSIDAQPSELVTGIVDIVNTGSGKIIDIIWGDPQGDREYDIYVKWTPLPTPQSPEWQHIITTRLNNYRIIPPAGTTDFIVAIQLSVYPKEYNASYVLYSFGDNL